MQMSITRALAELKLTDKKINQKISELMPAVLAKEKDHSKAETMVANNQSLYQSIKDLIKRRDAIKRKIVLSNATTTVVIGGVTMTVAEAIEKKTSIEFDKKLERQLREGFYTVKNQSITHNENVDNKADNQAKAAAESEAANPEVYKAIREMFVKDNQVNVHAINNIEQEVDRLRDSIDEFETEVDFVLSESNTKTTIEV